MKFSDVVLGPVFICLGLLMFLTAQDFPSAPGAAFGSGLFPTILAVGFAACGVILMVQNLRMGDSGPWVHRPDWTRDPGSAFRFFLVPGAILFYIILSPYLGMIVTSAFVLAVFFAVMRVRLKLAALIAILAPIIIFFAFSELLQVPLPYGLLSGLLS